MTVLQNSSVPDSHPRQLSSESLPQPYEYRRTSLVEPDWRRFPGWRDVTEQQWRDAQWQRSHCVKNVKQLRAVVGDLLEERLYVELDADHQQFATMSMLLPPHMLNTMAQHAELTAQAFTDAFLADPVRHYMLPIRADRDPVWPSHPRAERDSLHESEMWAVEGLTHRYPTKVLAELVSTCPQYCGHCTRMDLVGNSTPQFTKAQLTLRPVDRQQQMIDYLRRTPTVRDVVVSGGDVANVPWPRLEAFLMKLLDLDSIRDIRLATKALIGMPQHWLQPQVVEGLERVARTAARRGVSLAIHTHANHAQSITPLAAEATRTALAVGVRDVRNQGVLMKGVNASTTALLDLCFALQGEAGILPYYFYMCDMIPNSEHWRVSLAHAKYLQSSILGYLPGFATPRIVCDVPYVGKRWVHQADEYDEERGISYWSKNYQVRGEGEPQDSADAADRRHFVYYDPISSLPRSGQDWWKKQQETDTPTS